MQSIVESILYSLQLSYNQELHFSRKSNSSITAGSLVTNIINSNTIEYLCSLGYTKGSATVLLSKLKLKYFKLGKCTHLDVTLLGLVGLKRCSHCNTIQQVTAFTSNTATKDSLYSMCKACTQERSKDHYSDNKPYYFAKEAKRRADKLNATPKWADLQAIELIYKLRPEGHHVDHIIPLKGKLVSGLHVETNLQYLPSLDNLKKGNRFEVT